MPSVRRTTPRPSTCPHCREPLRILTTEITLLADTIATPSGQAVTVLRPPEIASPLRLAFKCGNCDYGLTTSWASDIRLLYGRDPTPGQRITILPPRATSRQPLRSRTFTISRDDTVMASPFSGISVSGATTGATETPTFSIDEANRVFRS